MRLQNEVPFLTWLLVLASNGKRRIFVGSGIHRICIFPEMTLFAINLLEIWYKIKLDGDESVSYVYLKKHDAFEVNNFSILPSEMLRFNRYDETFFLGGRKSLFGRSGPEPDS